LETKELLRLASHETTATACAASGRVIDLSRVTGGRLLQAWQRIVARARSQDTSKSIAQPSLHAILCFSTVLHPPRSCASEMLSTAAPTKLNGGTRLLRSQQRRDGGTWPRQRQLPVDLAKVPSGAPLPAAMALANPNPNLKVSQSDASVWLQLRIIPATVTLLGNYARMVQIGLRYF
jgi:ABC-type cobalamin transport system ATPase subunit